VERAGSPHERGQFEGTFLAREWTFSEAAQVAEHLKQDLKLDRVLFSIGGWIHRGYDNQHPDILPTAPECGGDADFAECARRVMQLGYLFSPHDNYQDIYRDSPSWDESYIMKTPEDKLAKGGHWAGGVAYLTCSQKAVELARRPQNLEAVRKLSSANAYFIDTTYASGLQECFDRAHPLTRSDDMRWKQVLSDYARQTFGVFGSECGREWAIPHSDFFEGLTGVSGGFYHDANLTKKVGGHMVPLFELVYRDCIAMYGKYGYDPYQAAGYVLHHILLGRPLNHHNIPPGLYWKAAGTDEDQALAIHPMTPEVQVGTGTGRELQLTYGWDVERPASGDWTVFVHFIDESGQIRFQNDYGPKPSIDAWQPGVQRQGPFTVHVPDGLKGRYAIRTGLFRKSDGQRASLEGRDNGERSYLIGRLRVSSDLITFEPSDQALATGGDPAIFTRAHNGWAEGMHSLDRFVKNCYEVTSPLNEITAQLPMTQHRFVTPDRSVQEAVFGTGSDSVTVVINPGASNHHHASKNWGTIDLPPNGFFVESAGFVAFLANSFNRKSCNDPALFTLRRLDKRTLARSSKIRVYHGFGPEELRMKRQVYRVMREAVLE
jgi:hypothetical protein